MDERTIGATIRQIRTAAGLTLTAVAKKAELTKSTLSKIETGQVSSPIATLVRLAHTLRVPLAEFFTEPRTDPPFVVTRRGKGRIIATDGTRFGYTYEALALGMRHKTAEPFLLTIRPGDGVGEFRHGGEEFIYMLSGRLRFTVGAETLTLGPGDSLAFDPRLKHTTRALGTRPARFLCVFVHDASASTKKRR